MLVLNCDLAVLCERAAKQKWYGRDLIVQSHEREMIFSCQLHVKRPCLGPEHPLFFCGRPRVSLEMQQCQAIAPLILEALGHSFWKGKATVLEQHPFFFFPFLAFSIIWASVQSVDMLFVFNYQTGTLPFFTTDCFSSSSGLSRQTWYRLLTWHRVFCYELFGCEFVDCDLSQFRCSSHPSDRSICTSRADGRFCQVLIKQRHHENTVLDLIWLLFAQLGTFHSQVSGTICP